jgi:hypothetical protein
MRSRSRLSFPAAVRGATLAAVIGATFALGSLRDALVYAPNGADADLGAPSAATAAPNKR